MINKSIEIYDNTINENTINILKEIIKQPEETKMYTQHRNPVIDRTKNIECKLGLFIHELLLQINDNTKYLEYWIHTDNKGIGFHRDCDDELLSTKNILLIPEKAHILYLDNNVYCPTMILNDNNMLMSPNVSGRLTRFDGNLYHSVGIPSVNFNSDIVIKKYNRNVILFNTWSEENFNSSTFFYNKNTFNFNYKNNKIECNNISFWQIISPIINDSLLYDYKLLFKFLREKNVRKTENYTKYFTDNKIEKDILEFMLASDIINHYNNRLLNTFIIKFRLN